MNMAGIIAAMERQESAEGIELDIAISYLSRLVILREMVHPGTGTLLRPYASAYRRALRTTRTRTRTQTPHTLPTP